MNFLAGLLRLLTIPIIIIGAFTCIGLIGFPILMLAKDIINWANKLENYAT